VRTKTLCKCIVLTASHGEFSKNTSVQSGIEA